MRAEGVAQTNDSLSFVMAGAWRVEEHQGVHARLRGLCVNALMCRPSRSGGHCAREIGVAGISPAMTPSLLNFSLVKQPGRSRPHKKTKLRRPRLRPCAGKHVIFRSFRSLLNEKGSMERR